MSGTYSDSNRHRMHEVSDTPRTDAVTKKSVEEDDGEYLAEDLLFHARGLETEIRQLEVAIYDLKTQNNELKEALDQVIEDRDSYHEENAELRKQNNGLRTGLPTHAEVDLLLEDKKRLDWLFHEDNERGCVVIHYWDKDREVYAERTLMTRSELDQAMQEEQ